jgi:hypothetical protein
MQNKFFIVLFLLLSLTFSSFAQSDSTKKEADYKPQIEGVVKVKFEESLYSGNARFSVRNSRLGVRGNLADNMRYRVQIEYSDEGKFKPLDMLVAYQMQAVTLSLGQQQYSFSTDLGRNPMQNIFSNRTLLSKFITTYADTTGAVRSLGSRDIGGLLTFDLKRWLPLTLKVGVFSGSGTNTAVWRSKVNVSTKIEYGKKKGLQIAASGYIGQTPYNQNVRMFGGELRYAGKQFTIDSELARRTYEQVNSHTLTAAYVQGFYKLDLPQNGFAKYAAPTLRYDYLQGGIHEAAPQPFDAQRASVGINFGVRQKMFEGEIRLNFEKYILAQSPAAFGAGQLLHDKLTLEMVVAF